MLFNPRRYLCRFGSLLLVFLAGVAVASATPIPITGLTATTTMGECCGSPLVNIVNGSGLSSYDSLAIHAASGNWLSTSKTGTVDFDLHGSWVLTSIVVWNTAFGVKTFSLSTSTDGVVYTPVAGFPVTLANVASGTPAASEVYNFAAVVASYARMTITDGYSVGSSTGLREVMFLGTSAVPEPGSVSLLAAGLGGLVLLARRRKRLTAR